MKTDLKNKLSTFILCGFFLFVSLWCIFKGPTDYSESERRVIASFPEINSQSIFSTSFMSDFETYTLDQFPLRENFRQLKAGVSFGIFKNSDNNGVFYKNGYAAKIEKEVNPSMLEHASERFNYLCETYLDESNKVFLSIIPDKSVFMKEQGLVSYDFSLLSESIREMNSNMKYIDIFPLLSLEDYYKTDTHWKQTELLDVAEKLAKEMSVAFEDTFEKKTLDVDFYGVYKGQLALNLPAETSEYFENETLSSCKVTSYDKGYPREASVYDFEKAKGKDAYEFFLSGSDALLVVENPKAETEKELVVFRDSFASSLIPLLLPSYKTITLVDIRYIQSSLLGNFVEFENKDILFLYSSLILNSSLSLK